MSLAEDGELMSYGELRGGRFAELLTSQAIDSPGTFFVR